MLSFSTAERHMPDTPSIATHTSRLTVGWWITDWQHWKTNSQKKKFKASSTVWGNHFSSLVLLSWGEFPMIFREVNSQSFAASVLDQDCSTNSSYQPLDWLLAGIRSSHILSETYEEKYRDKINCSFWFLSFVFSPSIHAASRWSQGKQFYILT